MEKKQKMVISSVLLASMCMGSYGSAYAADLNCKSIVVNETQNFDTQDVKPRVMMQKWIEYKQPLAYGAEAPPDGDIMSYEIELSGILFTGTLTFSRVVWEKTLRYALYEGYVFAQS